MKFKNLRTFYDDGEVLKMIDFELRKSGQGATDQTKILHSLLADRTKMFSMLEEIADGDGNVNVDAVRDLVDWYSDLIVNQQGNNQ